MKPLVKNGDLLFWRGKGFFAWVIRLFTRSQYCHVGVAYYVAGILCVVEAKAKSGVRLVDITSENMPDAYISLPYYFRFGRDSELECLTYLGEPYGWVDALRAGLGLRDTSKGVECAEFAASVMRTMGMLMPTVKTPESVRLAAIQQGGTEVKEPIKRG